MQQINFRKLPPQVREKLKSRRHGETEECVVVDTGGISLWYFLLPLSIVWLGLFFYLTDSFLWSAPYLITLSLLTLAATYVFVASLHGVFSQLTGIKPALVFTRFYVIEIERGTVRCWKLDELLSIDSRNNYNGHQYLSTDFTLNFSDDTQRKFVLRNIDQAEDVLEKIEYLRKIYFEQHSQANASVDRTEDDLYEVTASSSTWAANAVPQVAVSIVAILIALGAIYAAIQMNEYFDDKRSWDAALATNRAAPIRQYRETHPRGRWLREADEKLQQLYDAAEQKYRASLQEGYDPKAADAVLNVLRYARSSDNFRVKVVFHRDNNIPENEKLKSEHEVKNVLELGDSLSDEKMSERERSLLGLVSAAFLQIIPDDILEISSECNGDCVNFKIDYMVSAGEDIYYDLRQKDVTEAKRIFYPGIFITWKFAVQIPGQGSGYNFEVDSLPANELSYDSVSPETIEPGSDFAEILRSEMKHIYDSMVASAFSDFRANLVFKMGIGDDKGLHINEPLKNDDASPPADKGDPTEAGGV